MVELSAIHYTYAVLILAIIILMILKKDIILMCVLGLFAMGFLYSGNILQGIQTIYNGIIVSGEEFWSIIVIISLIVAMSDALRDVGADVIMIKPINKFVKNPSSAFFVTGIMMMLISFVLWPSPAVALIGAIVLPAAIKAGLPAIWVASIMNIFGHGVALSADYFIQGAPSITAKGIGVDDPFIIMKSQLPLWGTMTVVTVIVSFILMRRDLKKDREDKVTIDKKEPVVLNQTPWVKGIAIGTPLAFLLSIYLMYRYELKGGDAASLISGVSIIIMVACIAIKHNFKNVLEHVGAYMKDGFMFGIKTFAPVLIVGAFFFLGNEETARKILGENATGYLSDLGLYLSNKVSLTKWSVVLMQSVTAGIAGLGGAGFSALPLIGSIAKTLSSVIEVDKAGLASLGQLVAMWVGGGTIIPWGVIPVAAICQVNPMDLVKKNIIPVACGFIATVIVAIVML